MKLTALFPRLVLGLALALAFAGCTKRSDNPESASTSGPSTTATSASSGATTATTESAPGEAGTPELAEEVTETADDEAVNDGTPSQALPLRIVEMKPEPTSQWREGTHYDRLLPAQPTSALPGQIEVTEVFWYGCPHCYVLDPYLENWRKSNKPSYVSFVRVPVMWGPVHHTHARLFYTAEMLGKLDELHPLIFQEIHKNHDPLTDLDRIEEFFTSHGVGQADFQKAFSSFAVESSLKRAETLCLRYKVDSVPLIVVNGKYVTDVGKAGGPQQLIALIDELAGREHGT